MTRLSDVEIARSALTVFLPADAVTAVAIALAESGGNPAAHNDVPPDDSWGLWQINMRGALGPARRAALGLHFDHELTDPDINARAAAYVKRQQGWAAWSTYLHKSHAQFLIRAQAAVTTVTHAHAMSAHEAHLAHLAHLESVHQAHLAHLAHEAREAGS